MEYITKEYWLDKGRKKKNPKQLMHLRTIWSQKKPKISSIKLQKLVLMSINYICNVIEAAVKLFQEAWLSKIMASVFLLSA